MSEEILINVTPSETRMALVSNGVLQEVHIERASRRGWFGNIYKGRVSRVLPGMQAAFIEIGLQRAAFLHATDIAQIRHNNAEKELTIESVLHEGQEIIVQVIKDPIGTKGARLTTSISVPSRYLVLLPNDTSVGISTRIEEESERQRLRELIQTLMPDDANSGYIVRTNAESIDSEALERDVAFLSKLWKSIRERSSSAKAGEIIYEDLHLALRALRDRMSANVEKVRIDSREIYQRTLEFAQQFVPEWSDRLDHYSGDRPIFDLFGVEDDIQRALQRTSSLKSGGYLVIEQTEAMTTIDVNTGAYVGHRNLEETIYKTNLEAAQAIAKQVRLRNLGGIVILDFIDMSDEEHQAQVLKTLEKALATDPAKTSITGISALGLVEMTRKRTAESLEHILCEPCKHCQGRGSVKSADTVSYEIFREILRAVRQFEAEKLLVLATPSVVDHILDEESEGVAELEQFIGKSIRFQAEEQYTQEQFDVVLM